LILHLSPFRITPHNTHTTPHPSHDNNTKASSQSATMSGFGGDRLQGLERLNRTLKHQVADRGTYIPFATD
jgi:hypothetical protein